MKGTYDHFDMPSSNGQLSKADRLWLHRLRELAEHPPAPIATCLHCGRPLLLTESEYCTLCLVDISEERED